MARLLGVDREELDRLALSADPGAQGLVLLPYLEGERTPNRPDASGHIVGLRGANATPANLARAAIEGMLCGLADGLDAVLAQGVGSQRVLLLGGGSRSRAVRELAPALFGLPMGAVEPAEHVALGAARQAVWALQGEPAQWESRQESRQDLDDRARERGAQVRAAYAAVRDGHAL